MKKTLFLLLLTIGCGTNQSTDEIVKHEIELREARRGHELKKISAKDQRWDHDTLLVYYSADIQVKIKDSVINDSLFFIKSADGTILPFLKRPK